MAWQWDSPWYVDTQFNGKATAEKEVRHFSCKKRITPLTATHCKKVEEEVRTKASMCGEYTICKAYNYGTIMGS